MRNIFFIISFCFLLLYGCQKPQPEGKIITSLNNCITDSTFVEILNDYIKINDESYKSKFIQVFINYEQNIGRYIFFKTKSTYDLNTQHPDDYFYYRNHLVLLYSGLNHLLENKKIFPSDLNHFVETSELFKDIDGKGNYTSDFNSSNISLGNNVWELKVYHSFNDSIVLNKDYNGRFMWDGSRTKFDTSVKFVRPIIYEDKMESK